MSIFVRNYKPILLILVGTLVWSITMVKSGLIYDYGLGFWGPNGHDGVWHISIIRSLAQGDFSIPIFAGYPLQNYHLGYDIFLALLHRLLSLPASLLYFQIMPPIMAAVLGWLVYKFVLIWQKSPVIAWWSTFFVYFSGSLGWLINQGESVFWANQSISSLINPPYTLSLLILLAGLLSLQKQRWWAAVICFALLPQIKIYAGVLAFIALFVAGFKYKKLFIVLIISGLLSALMFIPLNYRSSSLLVFYPGWFLLNLFNSDHLNWPRYFSAINTYTSGGIWSKGIPAYLVALAIFLVGNLGTRLVFILKLPKQLDWLHLFLFSFFPAGIILPLLFIQSGTSWNTIQFFYYVQFVCSLLAGLAIPLFLKSTATRLLLLMLVGLTLPTTFLSLKHYLPARPPAKISLLELSALDFLARQPRGIVLTALFDKAAADQAVAFPPRPLYLYESTAYVSAFTGQTTFLEDEVNLNITGYPWQARRELVRDFFSQPTAKFLHDHSIRYLYLVSTPQSRLPVQDLPLQPIYTNSEVTIYAVN